MSTKPVVIAGGGLAGLSCASLLHKNNVPYLLIESSDHFGGRVSSEKTSSGFILDKGFQVLLNSYPELPNVLDCEDLELQKFNSGSLICKKEDKHFHNYLLANPVQHPSQIFSGLFSNLISISDKTLVLKLIAKAHSHRKSQDSSMNTENFLRAFGFSSDFIEVFWRPFLSGVFLDPKLNLDSDYFLFLVRCFSTGAVTIPKAGMQAIPQQMVSKLNPKSLNLNTRITEVNKNELVLNDKERIEFDHLVYAYNKNESTEAFHSVSTYYFSTTQRLEWDKWLVLIPPTDGIHINHLAVLSAVNPSCAPEGQHLVSASVVGAENPSAEVIRDNLEQLCGNKTSFQFIKAFHIKKALPKLEHKGHGINIEGNIIHCGDHLSSPSINGALRSGRLAADAILKKLG